MLSLRDVMSVQPEVVLAEAPAAQAAARMERRRGQPVLVADRDGELVGVLREQDLLRATDPDLPCSALVRGTPRTLDQDSPLVSTLAEALVDPAWVVVVTSHGRPVGTVSACDLARLAQHLLSADLRVLDLELDPAPVRVDARAAPQAVLSRLAAVGAERAVLMRLQRPVAILTRDELAAGRRAGVAEAGQLARGIVFTVHQTGSLRQVAHDLYRSCCPALPVLDDFGELVGVVGLEHMVAAVRSGLERLTDSAVA